MKDGGFAFPRAGFDGPDKGEPSNDGMKLRDWFAGQALAAMTVAPDYSKGPCNGSMAERAYLIADAMLAAREKQQ